MAIAVTLLSGYAALGSAIAANGTLTELSGNNYARVPVTVIYDPVTGTWNTTALTFGQATGTWTAATVLAIYDASSGGNLIAYATIPSTAVASGASFGVPAGVVTAPPLAISTTSVRPLTALGTITIPGLVTAVALTSGPVNLALSATYALSANPPVVTLTDAATIATDASKGTVFSVTLLAAGHTLGAPTNLVPGTTYTWFIKQDGTGSRTLSLNAIFKTAGGAPTFTTTASATDTWSGYYDGTNIWGTVQKAYA